MNSNQVTEDLANFSQPPPDVAARKEKEREKTKKNQAQVTDAQIKAAERLAAEQKEEQMAREKALLLRQLANYVKLMKEYYPVSNLYLNVIFLHFGS